MGVRHVLYGISVVGKGQVPGSQVQRRAATEGSINEKQKPSIKIVWDCGQRKEHRR